MSTRWFQAPAASALLIFALGAGCGDDGGGIDDDTMCPIASIDCPCTGGGVCDPSLTCDAGLCVPPSDDSDGDTPPYGPCPSGDDSECLTGETCVVGTQGGIDWSACTAGTCDDDNECNVTPDNSCTDLPGDGELLPYCVAMTCTLNDPCPNDMFCAQGFGTIGNVCVWPD